MANQPIPSNQVIIASKARRDALAAQQAALAANVEAPTVGQMTPEQILALKKRQQGERVNVGAVRG